MMNLMDPSTALLAACGGDTVKLFDVSEGTGSSDPCTLSYVPSPGFQVNSVKWNHTNLVVASAGDDKKISLWRKNGQSMGTVPTSGSDVGDNIDESILAISFSNKGSRYLCSGGSSQIVRVWDLQRKRCIKWLKGHTDTVTGVMYNCKDEHLASISLKGDLILHNLASGTRAAELKDPNEQVLRVLDYSRISRHVLVTAGDNGSVHMWDTTGRSPKVSWLKQHSAPTTGVCFSPSNDKAITSLCWQRSKPIIVNESTCTAEIALLGGTGEESILMPDPLPSLTSSSLSSATVLVGSRNSGRSVSVADASLLTTTSSGSISTTSYLSAVEETPHRNLLWKGGALSRLHAPRSNYNFNDDMEVFSPLVEVQPITPSLGTWWDEHEDAKNDHDRKPSSLFPSSARRFPYTEEGSMDPHPISHWKSNSTSKQDDTPSTLSLPSSMPITPPEAWGGDGLSDKLSHLRPAVPKQSRFMTSGLLTSGASSSVFTGLQDSSASTSHTSISSLTHTITSSTSLHGKDISNHETLSGFPFSSTSSPFGTKTIAGQANLEFPGSIQLALPRKYSSYAERMSTVSSSGDGASHVIGSPKLKKTGAEIREELVNSFSRSDTSATVSRLLPTTNGAVLQPQTQKSLAQTEQQQGTSSFMLQLVQRTLEETLTSVQKSIHEDMRNLHIELLRQFHMQETEMSSLMTSVLEKQAELMKEVQSLRKENQQLRQLL
ncbi:protein NEDD1 isoform X2 [Magnolia sinica]|uniref:protein NEDD1 isoform X2 n=1 Tax=Magnolia sinica TaxID=86752 RepID=UPI002658ED55|nr:protein NEDD1 isoform X2 [Magnolia sinica]